MRDERELHLQDHPSHGTSQGRRLAAVDAARGAAVALMLLYHFFFDLAWFGSFAADFNNDPFWLSLRALILSLFLAVSGISIHLSTRKGIRWSRYWRGVAVLVVAAALVSVGSYAVFPNSWIFFGVLHCIAVSRLLALPFVGRPWAAVVLGVLVLAAGHTLEFPLFDQPGLRWVGMMTHKPVTEDYVPLVPWTGVVLAGMFAGHVMVGGPGGHLAKWKPVSPAWGPVLWMGRHSLPVYLLHQPVLWAAFTALQALG